MRKCDWKRKIACLVIARAAFPAWIHASPVLMGGANPTTYSQNFDTLANSGTSSAWADDSTIPGWYLSNNNSGAPQTTYKAGPFNSLNTAASLSLGPNTDPTNHTGIDADRALGGRGNDSRYAVLLQNTSGSTINQVDVNYLVELWRTGGAGSQDALSFAYQLLGSAPASTPTTSGTFTSVPSMMATFGDPTTGFGPGDTNSTVGAIHPFVPATSVSNSLTGLNWADGQFLMLEWIDRNNSLIAGGGANDAAIGIDDVSLSAKIPEPASIGAMGLIVTTLAARSRRR